MPVDKVLGCEAEILKLDASDEGFFSLGSKCSIVEMEPDGSLWADFHAGQAGVLYHPTSLWHIGNIDRLGEKFCIVE